MRNAFLVLILLNLGFAAWHQWFATGSQATRSAAQLGPRLSLVKEPNGAVDETGAEQSVTSEPRTCVSVGPFPNRVVITELTSVLGNEGYTASQRVTRGSVWVGHWVYIDAIPTQAEASAIVADLNANGISDAYVIADGSSGSLVSLGVFTVESRAAQRLTEVRSLGYEPVLVDRSQPGDVYWLDVTANDGRTFTVAALERLIAQEPTQFAECLAR